MIMTRSLIVAAALLMAAPAAFAQCIPTGNPAFNAQCRNFEQNMQVLREQQYQQQQQLQHQQLLLEMERQRQLMEQQLRQQQAQ